MLDSITTGIQFILYIIGQAFDNLFIRTGSNWNYIVLYLRPILFIGVAISVIFVVFKILKSTVWGR